MRREPDTRFGAAAKALGLRRHENGRTVCCAAFDDDGAPQRPISPCDKCKAFFADTFRYGLRAAAMAAQAAEDRAADTARWLAERAASTTKEESMNNYAPPDPYRLTELRAASETTDTFEQQWKAARQREFDAEYARHDAARTPRLTAAETAAETEKYRAPDSYAAGIAALRAKESR